MAELGALIRRHREIHGLSQQELAERVGTHRGVLGRWERGLVAPLAPTFRALMDCLGATDEERASCIEPSVNAAPGSFAHQLRVHRYLKGFTERRLADLVGVDPFTVYRWEGAMSIPNSENLPALADALDWDLDEVIRLCPKSDWGGRRRTHNHEQRIRWATEAIEEAAKGTGVYRRLSDRWGISYDSVLARLRFLRHGGYIDSLAVERRRQLAEAATPPP